MDSKISIPAWTVEMVKECLPSVGIIVEGKEYTGFVQGRQLAFPKVWVKILGRDFEYSWQTIVNALNNRNFLTT
jgi:hypothetical protein